MAILNNSNAISAGGYDINNSVRLRSSASAYLNRTPASAGNRKTFTWSGWFKKSRISAYSPLFYADAGGNTNIQIQFLDDNTLRLFQQFSGVDNFYLVTTQVFRDPSAWYHVVVAIDTTQATSSNRAKMYVNGVQVTAFSSTLYPTLNLDTTINSTVSHYVGYAPAGPYYFDGYLAEVNFIDGSAKTPSDFGETDTTTGSWKPKAYTGTYGTNGFYLKFSDIATTSGSNAGLGKDFSGNGNYWNTNNISVTAGTTYDAMIDSPTLTSATVANYAVLNPLDNYLATISSGNLLVSLGASTASIANVNIAMTSGKWYAEFIPNGSTANNDMIGICDLSAASSSRSFATANGWYYYGNNGTKYTNNVGTAYGSSYTNGDVIGIAFDADNGTLAFYKNNVSQGTAFTSLTGKQFAFAYNTGTGAAGVGGNVNFGQRPFAYTPPTGFVALNTYNLPDSTIKKGNTVMDATTYTGTGATLAVTNAGAFKPDFAWLKIRSGASNHVLINSVTGVTAYLNSNTTNAELTSSDQFTSFNSNGFTLGANTTGGNTNANGSTYVGWQWQAGQGSTSSNTSGSITSTVSVNTTAGFSVVTYAGTSAAATVGHGLGVAPAMIIVKSRTSGTGNWCVYHKSLTALGAVFLNLTNAYAANANIWNNTAPTSTVFSLAGSDANTGNCVAYCWAEIAGFSKFGSYTANASSDGPFVYCGFRPRYVMIKVTSITNVWLIIDAARSPYNVANLNLNANDATAENTASSGAWLDFTSNGFKIRNGTDGAINTSSNTYIFAAFAENPFKNSLAR
jgi:hypothetical protein